MSDDQIRVEIPDHLGDEIRRIASIPKGEGRDEYRKVVEDHLVAVFEGYGITTDHAKAEAAAIIERQIAFDDRVGEELDRLRVRREAERILALVTADGPAEPQIWSLAELLADPAALELPNPVIPRLAWPGRVTLLAGREKLGKSTLIGAGVGAMTRGIDWLDGETVRGMVLWVTEEAVLDAARRLRDFGAEPEYVLLMVWGPDPVNEVIRQMRRHEPTLVVIDTLAALAAHAAPESGSASAWSAILRPLVRAARDTNCALLILHHARKADDTFRDSTEIGAAVDVIAEMFGAPSGTVRRIAVRGRYGRSEFAVRLDGHQYELFEDLNSEELIEGAIQNFVHRHPGCSESAVRKGVQGKDATIREVLARLVADGRVQDTRKSSRHAYRIAVPVAGNSRDEDSLAVPTVPVVPGRGNKPNREPGTADSGAVPKPTQGVGTAPVDTREQVRQSALDWQKSHPGGPGGKKR